MCTWFNKLSLGFFAMVIWDLVLFASAVKIMKVMLGGFMFSWKTGYMFCSDTLVIILNFYIYA
ncbi:hypothetical protein F5X96DRAFT_612785, partial [Biscogniauxia mediterranea]